MPIPLLLAAGALIAGGVSGKMKHDKEDNAERKRAGRPSRKQDRKDQRGGRRGRKASGATKGRGTTSARASVVPPRRGGSQAGPPVAPDVLTALPTMALLDMLNAAADEPETAPALDISGVLAQGLSWLSDEIGAREAQVVAGLAASFRGESANEKNRALAELRDAAMQQVQVVAGQLEQNRRGNVPAPQRAAMMGRILAAVEQLQVFALQAAARAADMMGAILETIAQRAANAAVIVGKGAGDAFAAFWGVKPATLLGGLGLGTLALVGLGVFLLVTPGGQVFLGQYAVGIAALFKGGGQLLGKTGVAAVKLVS